ncbi:MAG TPA: hypothetical protein VJ438_04925 [Candidatus Nanoarchaeia archaeon]|nr:hypothetical protein [Candidatus Nanoarchaeia archaeon]
MGEVLGTNLLTSIVKWIGIIFILCALFFGAWNYFLRDSLNLPWLSGFNSVIIWIIVGVLFILAILLIKSAKKRSF